LQAGTHKIYPEVKVHIKLSNKFLPFCGRVVGQGSGGIGMLRDRRTENEFAGRVDDIRKNDQERNEQKVALFENELETVIE
jgi:hypothetical protein